MGTFYKIILHFSILAIVANYGSPLFGHAGHYKDQPHKSEHLAKGKALAYEKINLEYLHRIKPFFQKGCMDCHGSIVSYPWYYNLPIAKEIIDSDTSKAKEHLDITKDFPFAGHGSPLEDLEAVKRVLETDSMPPFWYRLFHPSSKLSQEDKHLILDWVANSLSELKIEKSEKGNL